MWSWLDAIICDHEAEEVDFSEAKLELLWVEGAAISGGPGEEVTASEEVVFYVVIINDGVIIACLSVREAIQRFRPPLCVAITGCNIALGQGLVPVYAPFSDKGGDVVVSRV